MRKQLSALLLLACSIPLARAQDTYWGLDGGYVYNTSTGAVTYLNQSVNENQFDGCWNIMFQPTQSSNPQPKVLMTGSLPGGSNLYMGLGVNNAPTISTGGRWFLLFMIVTSI